MKDKGTRDLETKDMFIKFWPSTPNLSKRQMELKLQFYPVIKVVQSTIVDGVNVKKKIQILYR